LSLKITSENIKNKINDIIEKFKNKEIKYQLANNLINNQNDNFKLNKKITNIAKKYKLNKKQSIKKYYNDENNKIKNNEIKKIDNNLKKNNIESNLNSDNKIDKIDKRIKKWEENKKTKSKHFYARVMPYKLYHKKNDIYDITFDNDNYRPSSSYHESFHVEISEEFKNDDEFILNFSNF